MELQGTAESGTRTRHAGTGIASFVLGLVNVLLFILMIGSAVALNVSSGGHVDPHSSQAILLGLFVILICLICLIGTGLGLAGVIQKSKRRLFGIIGLCLNGGTLVLIILLMVIGLTHS